MAKDSGISGLLIIDKPQGLTSHDVVGRVRRIAGTRRVGHTGTLDPMATGVLVICLGKATRLIPYVEESGGADAKEYEAVIRFGFETTTDDAEGEASSDPQAVGTLTPEAVAAALKTFVGPLMQTPPAYSAKKVAGERAYARARRGEEVTLDPVRVEVTSAELLDLSDAGARVRFACSRGTYIRALARDLGRALGVGAHLAALRRTRSGSARIETAVPISELGAESLEARLTPMVQILEAWPRVGVNDREAKDLRLGRAITLGHTGEASGRVRVCEGSGSLVALATIEGARLQPFCVF